MWRRLDKRWRLRKRWCRLNGVLKLRGRLVGVVLRNVLSSGCLLILLGIFWSGSGVMIWLKFT